MIYRKCFNWFLLFSLCYLTCQGSLAKDSISEITARDKKAIVYSNYDFSYLQNYTDEEITDFLISSSDNYAVSRISQNVKDRLDNRPDLRFALTFATGSANGFINPAQKSVTLLDEGQVESWDYWRSLATLREGKVPTWGGWSSNEKSPLAPGDVTALNNFLDSLLLDEPAARIKKLWMLFPLKADPASFLKAQKILQAGAIKASGQAILLRFMVTCPGLGEKFFKERYQTGSIADRILLLASVKDIPESLQDFVKEAYHKGGTLDRAALEQYAAKVLNLGLGDFEAMKDPQDLEGLHRRCFVRGWIASGKNYEQLPLWKDPALVYLHSEINAVQLNSEKPASKDNYEGKYKALSLLSGDALSGEFYAQAFRCLPYTTKEQRKIFLDDLFKNPSLGGKVPLCCNILDYKDVRDRYVQYFSENGFPWGLKVDRADKDEYEPLLKKAIENTKDNFAKGNMEKNLEELQVVPEYAGKSLKQEEIPPVAEPFITHLTRKGVLEVQAKPDCKVLYTTLEENDFKPLEKLEVKTSLAIRYQTQDKDGNSSQEGLYVFNAASDLWKLDKVLGPGAPYGQILKAKDRLFVFSDDHRLFQLAPEIRNIDSPDFPGNTLTAKEYGTEWPIAADENGFYFLGPDFFGRMDFEGHWTKLIAAPLKLEGASLVIHQGELYAMGGVEIRTVWGKTVKMPNRNILRYSPGNKQWSLVGQLNKNDSNFKLISDGKRIFKLGGNDISWQIWSYTPEANAWKLETYFPVPRGVITNAVFFDGKLMILNGTEMDWYDTTTGAWSYKQQTKGTGRLIADKEKVLCLEPPKGFGGYCRLFNYFPQSEPVEDRPTMFRRMLKEFKMGKGTLAARLAAAGDETTELLETEAKKGNIGALYALRLRQDEKYLPLFEKRHDLVGSGAVAEIEKRQKMNKSQETPPLVCEKANEPQEPITTLGPGCVVHPLFSICFGSEAGKVFSIGEEGPKMQLKKKGDRLYINDQLNKKIVWFDMEGKLGGEISYKEFKKSNDPGWVWGQVSYGGYYDWEQNYLKQISGSVVGFDVDSEGCVYLLNQTYSKDAYATDGLEIVKLGPKGQTLWNASLTPEIVAFVGTSAFRGRPRFSLEGNKLLLENLWVGGPNGLLAKADLDSQPPPKPLHRLEDVGPFFRLFWDQEKTETASLIFKWENSVSDGEPLLKTPGGYLIHMWSTYVYNQWQSLAFLNNCGKLVGTYDLEKKGETEFFPDEDKLYFTQVTKNGIVLSELLLQAPTDNCDTGLADIIFPEKPDPQQSYILQAVPLSGTVKGQIQWRTGTGAILGSDLSVTVTGLDLKKTGVDVFVGEAPSPNVFHLMTQSYNENIVASQDSLLLVPAAKPEEPLDILVDDSDRLWILDKTGKAKAFLLKDNQLTQEDEKDFNLSFSDGSFSFYRLPGEWFVSTRCHLFRFQDGVSRVEKYGNCGKNGNQLTYVNGIAKVGGVYYLLDGETIKAVDEDFRVKTIWGSRSNNITPEESYDRQFPYQFSANSLFSDGTSLYTCLDYGINQMDLNGDLVFRIGGWRQTEWTNPIYFDGGPSVVLKNKLLYAYGSFGIKVFKTDGSLLYWRKPREKEGFLRKIDVDSNQNIYLKTDKGIFITRLGVSDSIEAIEKAQE